jgi:hypothetical protein
MEVRFGADFSKVRIHDDGQARIAARSIGARAFAVGSHIVFGEGEYAPCSGPGRMLLAHELTHTLQQINHPGVVARQRDATAAHEPEVAEGYLERLIIAIGAAAPEVLNGLTIMLAVMLGLTLIGILVSMIAPEFTAAVIAVLETVTIAGASLGSWLAAFGLSAALSEIVMAYVELDRAIRSPTATRADLEAAGRAWGLRTGEALALFIPALMRLPERIASLLRRRLTLPTSLPRVPDQPDVPVQSGQRVRSGVRAGGGQVSEAAESEAARSGVRARGGRASEASRSEAARSSREAGMEHWARYQDMTDFELFERYAVGRDETAAAVIRQRFPENEAALRRILGDGWRPPHSATAILRRGGAEVSRRPLASGRVADLPAEERALGYPRSGLATHTERWAIRLTDLRPGDVLDIIGQYDPCGTCVGAMQEAATRTGAVIRYWWPGGGGPSMVFTP